METQQYTLADFYTNPCFDRSFSFLHESGAVRVVPKYLNILDCVSGDIGEASRLCRWVQYYEEKKREILDVEYPIKQRDMITYFNPTKQ